LDVELPGLKVKRCPRRYHDETRRTSQKQAADFLPIAGIVENDEQAPISGEFEITVMTDPGVLRHEPVRTLEGLYE
jgi:hypothetical protein